MGTTISVGAAILGSIGSAIVDGISDIFSGSSSSGSYYLNESKTAANSRSNAEILAELKAQDRGVAEEKEKKIIDYINASMDNLLRELEKVNGQSFGGKTLNINIKEIRSKNDALKKEVVGFIGNYLDNRMVLSDPELARILEESNDKKRKKKFDDFHLKLRKQAIKELEPKIVDTVHKQEEIIRKEIQNRLTEVDRNMQKATIAYEEILQMKDEQDDAMIEEKLIQYCYQYELMDILLGQLES